MSKSRINRTTRLDPDFGDHTPDPSLAFAVTVEPHDKNIPPFKLVLLIPDFPYRDGGRELVERVLTHFLMAGDQFSYYLANKNKDIRIDSSLPLISYDPKDPIEWYWLRPPKYFSH